MNEIEYHPLAIEEYKEAIKYYKERSRRAVLKFQKQYETIEDQIIAFPESGKYDENFKDYQKRYLADYPYTIIYRKKESVIYILAVAHQSRRPDYWKHRIKDILLS